MVLLQEGILVIQMCLTDTPNADIAAFSFHLADDDIDAVRPRRPHRAHLHAVSIFRRLKATRSSGRVAAILTYGRSKNLLYHIATPRTVAEW